MIAARFADAIASVGLTPPDSFDADGRLQDYITTLDPNYGRPKVARTIERAGANGRPETVQASEYGDVVGSPMPKAVEPKLMSLGDRELAYDPFALLPGQSFNRGNSPDALLSAETTRRGQNLTDARSRDANNINREAARVQIINDPVQGPLLVDKGAGSARVATMGGTPVLGEKVASERRGAGQVVQLLDDADKLVDQATNSYSGAVYDQGMRVFGNAPKGAVAIGKLKALEGALMAKMPRMEGPQSNLDVQLYKQSVGQIGDPTVPSKIKKAAIATVREIQERYSGGPVSIQSDI